MGFLIKLKEKKIQNLEFVFTTAVENIIEGKIIALPTNSVYGLGCELTNLIAIE